MRQRVPNGVKLNKKMHINLSGDDKKALKALASKSDIKGSEIMRTALKLYLHRQKPEIPAFIAKLFWDVNVKHLDFSKHAPFIIERVLEYGNPLSFGWLTEKYDEDQIKDVILNNKGLSKKSRDFWKAWYNIYNEKDNSQELFSESWLGPGR